MYLKHFNLSERPFSITPDPRFLYMSVRHKEAFAHLLYGLGDGGGFVQLTGEVGTGKTTICRCLLEQVPEDVDLALLLNPKVTAIELIATVCDELGIEYPPGYSIKGLTDVLNLYLLGAYKRGRRTVLVIDEAQNLSVDVLEQVRLLTNLETATQKLLQIVLIGQPELRTLLASDGMRQLSQRITARYHLDPISREETEAYIKHRLQICGNSREIFSQSAINKIHKLSGGIPRLINVLCDRAMLGAYVEGKTRVDQKVLKKAAGEVLNEARPASRTMQMPWQLGVLTAVLALGALFAYQYLQQAAIPVPVPVAQSAAQPSDEPTVISAGVPKAVYRSVQDSSNAFATSDAQAGGLADLLMTADDAYERAAWVELFTLWSVEFPEDANPDYCEFAKRYSLQCLHEQGNWDTLRRLDRPVILKLAARDGRRVPVVLQYLDGMSAELLVGAELYRLNVGQIDLFWDGDYSLLLQTPPGGKLYLRAGSKSEDVRWLRTQLELIQGVEIPARNPLLFDQILKKHLLAFQRNNGLVADGVMGRKTIIHLNSQSSPVDIPRLSTGRS